MSRPATTPDGRHVLRIHVLSNDALRKAGLLALITAAGHRVTDRAEDADAVLADGEVSIGHDAIVVLGGTSIAAGMLSRDADAGQIDAALRAVAAGLIVRSADVPESMFAPAVEAPSEELLTPREVEVLVAIAEGLSNKGIAHKLGISQHTVKFHAESLFRKLRVRSRAEAIAKSIDWLRSTRMEV